MKVELTEFGKLVKRLEAWDSALEGELSELLADMAAAVGKEDPSFSSACSQLSNLASWGRPYSPGSAVD